MRAAINRLSLCFLDTETYMHLECFRTVASSVFNRELLIAENVTLHNNTIRPMIDEAPNDARFDKRVMHIARGESPS